MKRFLLIGELILACGLLVFSVSWIWLASVPKEKVLPAQEVLASPAPVLPTAIPTLIQAAPTQAKKPVQGASLGFGPCRNLPILMYHHVMEANAAAAIGASNLNVTPEVFRQQMDFLLGKGYQIISLGEMLEGLRGGTLPTRGVVLSFDDAYADFYEAVYPLLKEKNLKATVFVITQFVNGERYVSWSELKEMAGSGLVSVEDHTLNHPYLSRLSAEEVRNQIISARNIIEENVGKKVDFFAYPYGNSSAMAQEVLKEGGFLGAVLTTSGQQCLGRPYELSRIRIGGASLSRYGL
jgi:peptidoglycan/xylan/chitin deacetylase (PgdA/CDA1 family)